MQDPKPRATEDKTGDDENRRQRQKAAMGYARQQRPNYQQPTKNKGSGLKGSGSDSRHESTLPTSLPGTPIGSYPKSRRRPRFRRPAKG